MKSYDVCPQQIWTFESSEEVFSEAKTFTEIADYRPRSGIEWQSRSESTFLQHEEGLKQTTSWFLKCCDMVKRHYSMPFEKTAITEMWLNKETTGQRHKLHRHPLTIFSGIFYITESNSGTKFYQKDWFVYDNVMMGFVQMAEGVRSRNAAPRVTEFPCKPGTLVIFPANITHEVMTHKLEDPRITISFNAFMNGECGSAGGQGYLNLTVN